MLLSGKTYYWSFHDQLLILGHLQGLRVPIQHGRMTYGCSLISTILDEIPPSPEKKPSLPLSHQITIHLLKHSQVVINRGWQLPQWNHSKKQPRANLYVKEKYKQINQRGKKQSRKSGQNVIRSLKFIPLPVISKAMINDFFHFLVSENPCRFRAYY